MSMRGGKRGGRFNQPWRQRNNNADNLDEDGDIRIAGNNAEIKRRVHFKPQNEHRGGRRGGMRRGKFIKPSNMQRVIEESDNMNDGEGTVTYRSFRNGRPGSPPPFRQNFGKGRRLQPGPTGWFHIMIPHGQKYEQDFIFRSLQDVAQPEEFMPFYFKKENQGASFWVDDIKLAQRLVDANKKITVPSGHQMVILCRSGTPLVAVNEELKQQMEVAMAKRYSMPYKALNLERFHADPLLSNNFCCLSRPTIMTAALEVITKNIPDLEALNLKNNKIHFLDHFKGITEKLPKLKILYLPNNNIMNLSSLDPFKGLPIEEIDLNENPAKDKYKDHSMYVGDMRKRFPKLIKLDGVELPKEIGFDIEEKTLPPAQQSFLINPAGSEIIRRFLEQYYLIYDSGDRKPLCNAYHEQAQLSLTTSYSQHSNNSQRLTPYLPFNRNILRCKDSEQRCQKLKLGRLPIIALLDELPATVHDPQSFAVDLTLFTEKLIHLTVTGMYKERKVGGSVELIRSFQKSLTIVPNGDGFCIKNEVLHISQATPLQEKTIFTQTAAETLQQAQVQPAQSIQAQAQLQQDMITAMCQESGMNLEWSKKCLEESHWDFNRAVTVFKELHRDNKIPAIAFVK